VNKSTLLIGTIFAMAVLLSASIIPSAEAMRVTERDSSTGIKMSCAITNQDKLKCYIFSKSGLYSVEVLLPSGESPTVGLDCKKNVRPQFDAVVGDSFLFFVNGCNELGTVFSVDLVGEGIIELKIL